MKPGIYRNLPIQEYHNLPGYSSSQLRLIDSDSPLALKAQIDGAKPDLTVWGQTNRPMCIGGAVAALMDSETVFQKYYMVDLRDSEAVFQKYYMVAEEAAKIKSKNSNDFKNLFRQITLEYPDHTIILPQEYEQAQAIVAAIHNHPDPETRQQIEVLFSDPGLESEVSYFLEDEETGLLLKSRPDIILPGLLGDVKTITTSCAPRDARKRILNGGYHIQAAMGLDIVNQAQGTNIENWLMIFVEQSPPHDVGVYYLGPRMLEEGFNRYRTAVYTLRRCLDTDTWPGKVHGIQEIDLYNSIENY